MFDWCGGLSGKKSTTVDSNIIFHRSIMAGAGTKRQRTAEESIGEKTTRTRRRRRVIVETPSSPTNPGAIKLKQRDQQAAAVGRKKKIDDDDHQTSTLLVDNISEFLKTKTRI